MRVFISLSSPIKEVDRIAENAIAEIDKLFKHSGYARKYYRQITNYEIEYTQRDGSNVFLFVGKRGDGASDSIRSFSYFVHSSKDAKAKPIKELKLNELFVSPNEQSDMADQVIQYLKQNM
jgi:hypothetical protein